MNDSEYLLHKIRARCVEDGDCSIWPGAMSASGSGPVVTLRRKNIPVRKVVWEAAHGRPFPSDRVASVRCKNKACLDEKHIVAWTRTEVAKVWNPDRNRTTQGAKLSARRRQDGRNTLNAESVAVIRSTGECRHVLAERYGVAVTSIDRIRRGGGGWRDYSNPFAGLGARGATLGAREGAQA